MRKVVSNTTPILSLLKIGKLDLLKELYGSIIIPQAVYDELEAGKDKNFYVDLKTLPWIKIERIKTEETKLYLFDLDAGEAEVIILAHEQNADLVILDESLGRRYAKQLDLTLTGTVGVLLKAKQKGLIDNISIVLQKLVERGSWLNPKLITKARELAGE